MTDVELTAKLQKLQGLAELVELYPYMTRDLQIRELRHRLLPHVQTYMYTHGSKYDLEENELYLEERASDPERQLRCDRWLELEDRICAVIGSSPRNGRDVLIAILTRGREVFVRSRSPFHPRTASRFKYEGALRPLLTAFVDRGSECPGHDPSLPGDLISFYGQCFPDPAIKHVALKSQLHRIWESPKLGAPRLTRPFKEYLLTADRLLIESLPGHVAASGSVRTFSRREAVFGDILEQLFARDVFWPFQFLSV